MVKDSLQFIAEPVTQKGYQLRGCGIALAMGDDAFDAKRKAEVAAHNILIRTAADPAWRGQEEMRMLMTE